MEGKELLLDNIRRKNRKAVSKKKFTKLFKRLTKVVNSTCESGQVPGSGGCNTAAQIHVQHIVGMVQSPSFTELKQKKGEAILTNN